MVNPVSSASTATPVVSTAATSQPVPAAAAKPQTTAPDKVTISNAAKALQELTETSVQTAKEASSGDLQAQRLQVKEAAAKSS